MLHRGPDEGTHLLMENVGFGFRRLNIIDLLTGSQPICNEDRSIWLSATESLIISNLGKN